MTKTMFSQATAAFLARSGDDAPEAEEGPGVGWGFRVTLRWKSTEVFNRRGARDIGLVAALNDCDAHGIYADTQPDGSGIPEQFPHVATFVIAPRSPRRRDEALKRLESLPVEFALLMQALSPLARPGLRAAMHAHFDGLAAGDAPRRGAAP